MKTKRNNKSLKVCFFIILLRNIIKSQFLLKADKKLQFSPATDIYKQRAILASKGFAY